MVQKVFILPVTETLLVAMYDTGAMERVKTSDISKTRKSGWWCTGIYTTKQIDQVTDGKNIAHG